ncbi:MAG: hypothetical protein LBE08_10230, partial [Bifidobacteriaceae bacterium]|nr:hypothetical protein [Bifidobacteriaceae bacterium]
MSIPQAGSFPPDAAAAIGRASERLLPSLIEFRRDLHRQPETARQEIRTTSAVLRRLAEAGLNPQPFRKTGLLCDLGPTVEEAGWPRLALRADLDALPVPDRTGTPWRSAKEGTA